MDFSSLPLVSLMKAKLNYASERQAVLAQNIANADTPDYRAQDIEKPDFKRMLQKSSGPKLEVSATDPKHISHGKSSVGHYKVVNRRDTYEQSPVGNNVAPEEEMMRVAENQAEYQKVLHMYRKTVTLFKTALGNSNNGG